MKRILVLLITSLSVFTTISATSRLTEDECRIIVKDLERMSNIQPAEIEAKAPEALEKLRNGESPSAYFIAFNIYAENLFNKGKVEKAGQEIEKMINEAFDQPNTECQVIALRTQGQFYYKLGLYDRAAACFRKAMEICPRYDSNLLDHCFTWSSTLFWLVQSDIRIGRIEEAEHWLNQMDGMMQWLEKNGNIDEVGYKPVMILGLKAKIALQRGNLEEAQNLLSRCPQYIKADISPRAYVEYYVTRMLLLVDQGKHSEALPLLDQLVEMHKEDYKPIAAEYLYQKGVSLAALGRFEESSKTLREYIELKDKVNEMALAQQLDELSTRLKVQKLEHERDNMRIQLMIVMAFCIVMAIFASLIIVNQKKLKHKNQTLARHISELNRLEREAPSKTPMSNQVTDPEDMLTNAELIETGNKIVDFINRTQCYLRADCSRDTIKEGLGVSERVLAKAIVAATGISFVNYINQQRLKVSIGMLEDKPDMTINDISAACGFGTVRQFQRTFKQHYDLSPSAYREARKNTLQDNP